MFFICRFLLLLLFMIGILFAEVTVQLTPSTQSVQEGDVAELMILKFGVSEEPVTVTLTTMEGSANSESFCRQNKQF